MLAGPRRSERAGAAQPVKERGRAEQRAHVGGDLLFQRGEPGQDLGRAFPRKRRHAARDHDAAAEAAAAHGADQPQHPFLVQREAGGGDREAGRVGEPHRDVQVVRDPLEFRVRHPDEGGLARDLAAGDRLDRVAVGEGVSDGGDAFGPLGEQDAVARGHAGEPAGHAAVLVEDPHVEVRDRLAGGLDQVLHRLGHPGADRAVRDREQPVSRHVPGQRVAGLDERGEPGMTLGDDPGLVVDQPLVPERRADRRGRRVSDG